MALYFGSTKANTVVNWHYVADTSFHYTTSQSGSTFLQTTFAPHSDANRHLVIATVNGAANDDATAVIEKYSGGSWGTDDNLRGATGPGGSGEFRGSFGDFSVVRATTVEDHQTVQYTASFIYDFSSGTVGYRVRYTCENTGGFYTNRSRDTDGGYNTNTSISTLIVLELVN